MSRKAIDLTGKTFGYWYVIKRLENKKDTASSRVWQCKCLRCGKIKNVLGANLSSGRSTQCQSCAAKHTRVDVTGKIFYTWRVLEFIEGTVDTYSYYLCECVKCGYKKGIRSSNLKNGKPKNCKSCKKK